MTDQQLLLQESSTPVAEPAKPSLSPEEEGEAWLRLAFVALPAGRCRQALEFWRSPARLMATARQGRQTALLQTPGFTPSTVERLTQAALRDLREPLEAMQRFGIRLLLEPDDEYPAALRGIPDPPPYLFIRGTLLPRDEVAVALVGTRHATEYGRGVAERLSSDLSRRGVTIVSGMARGIDTAAHRGALDAGGRTFAVCGCGLDVVYPSENGRLMEQIVAQGACFSEFAPTVHPEAWHFPARNRIISGLSAGVVVVEAGERSGALITADFALEQGRDVFAVPGNIYKAQSRGTHALIKHGAALTESADDVVNCLNSRALPFVPSVAPAGEAGAPTMEGELQTGLRKAPRPDLSPLENQVYLVLEADARHVDDLAEAAGVTAAQCNATLVLLELKGAAHRLPGNMFTTR